MTSISKCFSFSGNCSSDAQKFSAEKYPRGFCFSEQCQNRWTYSLGNSDTLSSLKLLFKSLDFFVIKSIFYYQNIFPHCKFFLRFWVASTFFFHGQLKFFFLTATISIVFFFLWLLQIEAGNQKEKQMHFCLVFQEFLFFL